MKLREKLNEIKRMEDTTPEVLNMIYNEGKITGSSLWGVMTEESDIDVVLPPDCSLSFQEVINEHEGRYIYVHEDEKDENEFSHYFQDQFQSCYVKLDKQIFNLLFMHKQDYFDAWNYATDRMCALVKEDKDFQERIRNKETRVALFERFKRVYLQNLK